MARAAAPTGAWTFDFRVLLAPSADGRYHWDLCTFLGRFVGLAEVRWFDEPERAKAILASVALSKSSTDGFPEIEKTPEFFARPSMDARLAGSRASGGPPPTRRHRDDAGVARGAPPRVPARQEKVIVGETTQ